MSRIKTVGRRIRFLLKHRANTVEFWKASVKAEPGLSNFHRLMFTLEGHDPVEASWYYKANGSLKGFVSRYDMGTSIRSINFRHKYELKDKLCFSRLMVAGGFAHPEVLGFTFKRDLFWNPGGRNKALATFAQRKVVVLKPLGGALGRGIEFLRSLNELDQRRSEEYIVCAFAQQADYAAKIFPGATNTIRVLTISAKGEAHIAAAAHRFGVANTAGVDNFYAGGISAPIDLENGCMGKAAIVTDGNRLSFSSDHPESGEEIEGVKIPNWKEVKDFALALANYMPYLPYIGWDIVVTNSGPVVLEGNSKPWPALHQMHGPFPNDANTRVFFDRLIS